MDGMYAGYFTGAAGVSLGLFIFRKGQITGFDAGGLHYDGTYTDPTPEEIINGTIVYVVRPGVQLITGTVPGPEPMRIEFPLSLPSGFADGRIVSIPTPTGVVNARFEKLRELPEE